MRFTTIGRASGVGPLGKVRLTESERREAEHYLELGERAAAAMVDISAVLISVLHATERALRSLSGSKSTG